VTPGLPVVPAPPIGTLPPTGVTPGLPTAPPTGVTPGLPVTPAPPIGTLPPTGVTPGLPTAPPTGVTPGLPVAPAPPIGTLPPTGPTVPGTVPGITGALQQVASLPPILVVDCSEPGTAEDGRRRIDSRGIVCADAYQGDGQAGNFGAQAPLTPGRQFGREPRWNAWADSGYTDNRDGRFGIDRNGTSHYLSIGADHRFSDRFIAGASVTANDGSTGSFNDTWITDSNGFTVGPYVGYRLSSAWTLNGSVSAGWTEHEQRVAVLSASYRSQQYSTSVSATGQYGLGNMLFRPGVDISYTYTATGAHDLSGTIGAIPVVVNADASRSGYGMTEMSMEVNHAFRIGGSTLVPYAEPRVRYEYLRPGGGMMFSSDFTRIAPSPWSGALRVGLRASILGSTFIEAAVGYLSVGQPDLNTGEGRLFLSFGF
jgi:hypothetical protein